jgi:pimeloyl-ACP methyl ester carboxylesterase
MQGESTFTVEGSDGRISGWRLGSGEPVLLLHGGPGLSDYLGSLTEELADGYTTFRYQQRGLEPSTETGPFTVERHSLDAIEVIDHIGVDRVLLIGHSWGGHLAMHLAVSHPNRLKAVVIVDPLGAVGDGGETDMTQNMTARIPPANMARAQELDEAAMRGEGTPDDAVEGLRLVWPGYFADPDTAPPMPPMQMSLPCYSETWESIHAHFASDSLEAALPSVKVPTLFVLCSGSPIPVSHGQASAALIPGASVRIVEGAGHFPWMEQPGVVRAALDSIIAV